MAITTTGIMKSQLMSEPLDTTPEAGMEGGVNRPSIAGDLMSAMNDVDFRQLLMQYQAMSGSPHTSSTPLTNEMMNESMPKKATFVPPETSSRTPIEETDMGQAMGQRYEGHPRGRVIDPNEMPSLQGTFSGMPVLRGYPNHPLGIMQKPFEIEI